MTPTIVRMNQKGRINLRVLQTQVEEHVVANETTHKQNGLEYAT